MTQINTYAGFNGRCREAMTFYHECFGGDLILQAVKDTPMAAQWPAAKADQILHSKLTNGDLILMGSDMEGPGGFVMGNNIALAISCSSEEEITAFFEKLSFEGDVVDPLQKQFWGGLFGVVNDRFGIRWMLNYEEVTNS